MRRKGVAVLLLTVFAVNFISLVYQVLWTRNIMAILGSTALSISTTLTVFLSGIALGGYLGGVWIRRARNKYMTMGALLLLLGAYCFFIGYLFGLVDIIYISLSSNIESALASNLLKLVLIFAILIFPTTIIGSMFPICTYLYSVEFGKLGKDVAFIYFLDTLGAALGAIVSGFVLVPHLGLRESSFIAALAYVILGALVLVTKRSAPEEAAGAETAAASAKAGLKLDPARAFILAALFFGGFSALMLEVVWSRYFHLIFGTSIYAFSIVIAAFLLGISIGSFAVKRRLESLKNPLLLFAYIEILIGGFALLVIRSSTWLETIYFKLFQRIDDFYLFQGMLFLIAFLIMLVPAALMGANFPLAVRIFGRQKETRGEDAGITFAFNTAGGIAGAFAAGFFIIPSLGLEKANFLAFAAYFLIGFAALVLAGGRAKLHYALGAALAGIFIAGGYFFGNPPSLNWGVYYGGIRKSSLEEFKYNKYYMERNIVYSRHGHYGLVSVRHDKMKNELQLINNGKVDASNNEVDTRTQLLIGHLPLFLHKNPERVLNIGLGGGFTVGAIKAHPLVKHIDVVEIDPLVVEATGTYFRGVNNDALNDPRISVHIHDGRHFVKTTPHKYDVIVSEPPNIWVSGVSMLFTREFYKTADEKLKKGGLLFQWAPGYEMSTDDMKLIIKTLRERFEYVSYWVEGLDVAIIASHEYPAVDPAYIESLLAVPRVKYDAENLFARATTDFIVSYIQTPVVPFDMVDYHLRDFNLVNTDNLPHLEFNTARNMFNFKKTQKESP
ncbi:MAG: fused MFS/spermidine synthase [Deltaproteobacteria bacterium]|nr:fused MFS/spermidine synthase [Deltaproteobacteria bacterium]MBZ0219913.1 fused MFS/spermidine synthase [Deltaproteobacteria bacterium]